MSENVLVLLEITCFISSFLEFVLQMEKRLCDNSYTPTKKLEWDTYTSMWIPSALASLSALMLANALIYAPYILNGLLDFDQNLPVYNTWTYQNPD